MRCPTDQKIPVATPPLILLGAGGHGKVVVSLAHAVGRNIAGVCDPLLAAREVSEWCGMLVMGDDIVLNRLTPEIYELALGIGMKPWSHIRAQRYRALAAQGFRFPKLIHPAACVDQSVFIADGAQIMAGVVLQPDVHIGCNSIINTSAIIDHDSKVGAHSHVAPAAVLCGGVCVGDETFIGANVTILPGVKVGHRCLVAAGSTLACNLPDGGTYAPHRKLR